jgi:hypothetical protein
VDGAWKFVTNSRGFRRHAGVHVCQAANTLRVLSLGDSHTQGYEVHQDLTFSAVLERYLKYHKINAEAINTGVSGFSTAEELVLLENEGVKYSPDVVSWVFSPTISRTTSRQDCSASTLRTAWSKRNTSTFQE